MIGSFLTRGLVMVLGYAYPAFECYKTVEKNKIEIEELRFWILVAMLTVTERIGDVFISWVPMYSEAKLAFYLYLWYPKTRGTTYVYDSFFKPYMAKHGTEIDRSLLELRTRAGDMAVIYWQRAASYAQTRIIDIVQFVASQTTVAPRLAQPKQAPIRTTSGTILPTVDAQPLMEEPLSPTSSTSSSHHSEDVTEVDPPAPSPSAPLAPNSAKQNPKLITASAVPVSQLSLAETSAAEFLSKPDPMEINTTTASPKQSNTPPKVTVMDETLKITRGRLGKKQGNNRTCKIVNRKKLSR